ncbi:hypothetical protein [Chryseobacterium sp. MDT2-18]|nr:hypothetical protein [Chryseobacterium sp. MDT2-18]MDQ0477073.1 hypothetical protein [Chryseobacterium sp. MDT2-18]
MVQFLLPRDSIAWLQNILIAFPYSSIHVAVIKLHNHRKIYGD